MRFSCQIRDMMDVKMRNNELCKMLFFRESFDWSGKEVKNHRQLKIVEREIYVKKFLILKSKDIFKKHDFVVFSEILNAYSKWISAVYNNMFSNYKSKYKKYFIFERDKKTKQITGYYLNQNKVYFERKLDGVFTLLANQDDLDAQKIVDSYKNLQEVELPFGKLKYFVNIRSIFYWIRNRVHSYFFICILALLLKRIFEINYMKEKIVTEPLEEINKNKLVKYKVKFSEKKERNQNISKIINICDDRKNILVWVQLKTHQTWNPSCGEEEKI